MNAMRAMKRLGVPGGLGVLMLAGSAWTHVTWLPARQMAVNEAGSHSRRMRHELQEKTGNQGHSNQVEGPASPQEAWQAMWRALPGGDRRVAMPAKVLAQAVRYGLRIASVQNRGVAETWSARPGEVLWHQRMVMPVEGSYPALRAWLNEMLEEPALAIDALDIQRDDASRDLVKGRVSVSLYSRQALGGPHP
jgi:hypothetical protein